MKNILLVPCLALCLCPLCFSQPKKDWSKDPSYQRYLKRSMPVLEEDAARIVTQTKKTEFSKSENIVLGVSLQNVGVKTFGAPVGIDDPDFFFDIEVIGPDGHPIAFSAERERRRDSSGPSSWSVSPKGSMNASVWLNSLFLLNDSGKYTVVVSKKFRRNDQLVTISSVPLAFTLNSSDNVARWDSR